MLGRQHALSGGVAFAALAPVLHVRPAYLAAGVALCAGAGVLPDIDHPDSSISRSFGFLTEAFAWLVNRASGGHRHGTHSLVGTAVFTGAAYLAGWYQLTGPSAYARPVLSWHYVPAMLILALLYSAALRALHIGGHHGDGIGVIAAAVTCWTQADLTTLPAGLLHVPLLALAVALGCAAHIAGDEITHGGCPLLWPVSDRDFHLLPERLRITTGKFTEVYLIGPALTVGLLVALAADSGLARYLATC